MFIEWPTVLTSAAAGLGTGTAAAYLVPRLRTLPQTRRDLQAWRRQAVKDLRDQAEACATTEDLKYGGRMDLARSAAFLRLRSELDPMFVRITEDPHVKSGPNGDGTSSWGTWLHKELDRLERVWKLK